MIASSSATAPSIWQFAMNWTSSSTAAFIGFAIATWSLPGLAFALFTAANVAPRASSNLKWYRETFPGYPADRKALIPRVW